MVLLFLVVVIFGMLFLFILSFAEVLSQGENTETYLNNLLLSVVRTDTGYTDDRCKLISDSIACAFQSPSYDCGGTSSILTHPDCNYNGEEDGDEEGIDCGGANCPLCTESCDDVARTRIAKYMGMFDLIKQNFDYLFYVKPQGFVPRDSNNQIITFEIGNTDLRDAEEKTTASHVIYKGYGQSSRIYKAFLIVVSKTE
jgi:hypothetical protein